MFTLIIILISLHIYFKNSIFYVDLVRKDIRVSNQLLWSVSFKKIEKNIFKMAVRKNNIQRKHCSHILEHISHIMSWFYLYWI